MKYQSRFSYPITLVKNLIETVEPFFQTYHNRRDAQETTLKRNRNRWDCRTVAREFINRVSTDSPDEIEGTLSELKLGARGLR